MTSVDLIIALVKIAIILFALLTGAAYLVLLERWIAAWVQDRRGPNRVGIPFTKIKVFGLGQPLADGLKMIFKEEYTPAHVDKFLYTLAPISIMAAAIIPFAVIPFGSMLPPFEMLGEAIPPIQLTLAPGVDVGMIFVFAMGSIAVYGVILGGWASNNKYSFLGGLRSSAQLIAYELPLGLGILGVVLVTGSLRLDDIIHQQADTGVWNVVMQPIGFLVFMVASFAESARLPFDLPEAEQELIGGYHTEYSGLRLLLYLIAEFLHMVTASFLISILFLGGWHLWGVTGSGDEPITWVTALLRVAVLLTKVFGMIVFFMLVRWSWPRFRFDQLMSLAWKVMLPLGMVNLAIMAVVVEYHAQIMQTLGGSQAALVAVMWALAILAWVIAGLVSPLSTDNRPRLELSDRL